MRDSKGTQRRYSGLTALLLLSTLGACIDASSFVPLGGIEASIEASEHRLVEGDTVSIPVSVVRGAGRDEEIVLEAQGLPLGVTAERGRLEAGMTSGFITLRANGAVIGTEFPIGITVSARNFSAELSTKIFITGKPGSVDQSFGSQGYVSFPLFSGQVLPLASGSLLLLGMVANAVTAVKVTAEGIADVSFGDGGYAMLGFPGGAQREQSSGLLVVEQADGKLLIITALDDVGTTTRPDQLAVARLLPNGAIDQTYGSGGYALDPVPNRPYAAALGIDGELLLWNGAASDSRLTRVSSSGVIGSSSITYGTNYIVHLPVTMIVQPDGKAVIPAYDAESKPALFRFTSSLTIDPTFGRDGKLATNLHPFMLRKLSDNSYVAAFSAGTPARPAVMRFDSDWRSLSGFEDGFVSFPFSGAFQATASLPGATLAAGAFDNAARIGRIFDNGMIDQQYGVNGLATVTSLAGDSIRELVVTTRYGLFVVITRGATTTEIYRVWQ